MFQFYGRNETSLVCACGISRKLFAMARRYGSVTISQERVAHHMEESEFILCMERDVRGVPTGRELTMFVTCIVGDHVKLEVVSGNPDEFWKQQVREV